MRFLADHPCPRPWLAGRPPKELEPRALFIGKGARPFEVAVAAAADRPAASALRVAWDQRHAARPAEVLLVVLYLSGDIWKAAAAGPSACDSIAFDLEPLFVERIARLALAARDRHVARRIVGRLFEARSPVV